MRRSWKPLLVAAAVLLGTFSVMTLASASTDRSTVLHLTLKNEQPSNLDLGKHGPSQGDEFILAADVWMSGKKVGTVGAVCVLTRLTPKGEEDQCVLTFSLPKGQITAQVLLVGPATNSFAITGGTGAYRDAGGYGTGTMHNPVTLFVDDLSN
jgi:hypothetical protein